MRYTRLSVGSGRYGSRFCSRVEFSTISQTAPVPIFDERVLLQSDRFNLWLLGSFALLAALGIYGVMTYTTAQRTRELGIRLALGAQTGDVLKLVVVQGMKLAVIGVAIGLAGAFAFTRMMATLLFEVTPTDAMTYTIVSVGLLFVALLACYIPARRATKVDPLVALRYE
jgi:ABC-type antimicrobial peptide transport system permease subunit